MLRLTQRIEESRLALVMSGVVFALVFNIIPYCVCGSVLTDSVDIEAFRPELTTPQHLFDLWILFENSSCRDALDRLDDVLRRC